MDQNKSNNPQGHNQYTKDSEKSTNRGSESKESMNKQSSGHKGQVNNPEGHNQYSKNR